MSFLNPYAATLVLIINLCWQYYNRSNFSLPLIYAIYFKGSSVINSSDTMEHFGIRHGKFILHSTGAPISGDGSFKVHPVDYIKSKGIIWYEKEIGQGHWKYRYISANFINFDAAKIEEFEKDIIKTGLSCQEHQMMIGTTLSLTPLKTLMYLNMLHFRWKHLLYIACVLLDWRNIVMTLLWCVFNEIGSILFNNTVNYTGFFLIDKPQGVHSTDGYYVPISEPS